MSELTGALLEHIQTKSGFSRAKPKFTSARSDHQSFNPPARVKSGPVPLEFQAKWGIPGITALVGSSRSTRTCPAAGSRGECIEGG